MKILCAQYSEMDISLKKTVDQFNQSNDKE